MATRSTLRDILVKIYQPRRGIIEFGDGPPATQDGAPALGVLGGGAGDDGEGSGGGSAISLPAMRFASGGGVPDEPDPFDYSQFFQNPNQLEVLRGMFERGGDRGFGGRESFDRGLGDLPEGEIGDIPGGYSTLGGLIGGLLPVPFAGTIGRLGGGIADIIGDLERARRFDPEYDPDTWGHLSAIGNELFGDIFGAGQSHTHQARDDYRGRTGTGLNDAALDAAERARSTGSSYSGPKGVVGRSGGQFGRRNRSRGGDRGFGGPGDRGGRSAGVSGGGFRGGDENAA